MGPVGGPRVLGLVVIGPGGADSRAILVGGTEVNRPVGNVCPFAVAGGVPTLNRGGRRGERDPLMGR